MLITNESELKKYTTDQRIWQGIPSIEVTKKGRIFSTFYTGGTTEPQIYNYSLLVYSDDGKNFTEPVAVARDDDHRCYDPTVWIDPLGRLWFVWSIMPDAIGAGGGRFTFAAFLAGAITNAIPGIIIQILLVPIIVMVIDNPKFLKLRD